MDEIAVALLNEADVEWLEGEFNSGEPQPGESEGAGGPSLRTESQIR